MLPTLGSLKSRGTASSDYSQVFHSREGSTPLSSIIVYSISMCNYFLSETEVVLIPEEVEESLFVVVRPLTLPKEGDSDGDITPILVTAIREKKLNLYYDLFVRACASHLTNTQPTRSKAIYAEYAKIIVEQFGEHNPCVYDRNKAGYVSYKIIFSCNAFS